MYHKKISCTELCTFLKSNYNSQSNPKKPNQESINNVTILPHYWDSYNLLNSRVKIKITRWSFRKTQSVSITPYTALVHNGIPLQ